MSILKRFSDIMSSNINALLDKAEDPVKMIDQLMRNLNDDLNKVKAETASVMAEETRAKREYDECESEVNKMLSYAKKAVDAGNDDDARVFLTKKASLTENSLFEVKAGDIIAIMGDTGEVSGVHLHFQFSESKTRKTYNPLNLFTEATNYSSYS